MHKETGLVYWLSVVSAALALLIVFVVTAFELYVRWKLNQNFTFLGGFELEALTLLGGGLLAMLYLKR